jgi:holo-[acyl-carrier protein] synthase
VTSGPGSRPGSGAAIGIDLVEIDRVERALQRHPRLAERLFRTGELISCRSRRRPGRHLAARFAAKEAAIKALGGGFPPRDVEVIGDPAPALRLHGAAADVAAKLGVALTVSLTHSRDNAAAVVRADPSAGTA